MFWAVSFCFVRRALPGFSIPLEARAPFGSMLSLFGRDSHDHDLSLGERATSTRLRCVFVASHRCMGAGVASVEAAGTEGVWETPPERFAEPRPLETFTEFCPVTTCSSPRLSTAVGTPLPLARLRGAPGLCARLFSLCAAPAGTSARGTRLCAGLFGLRAR